MKAARLMQEEMATIEGSQALHCCAAHHVTAYIEFLLNLLLPTKRNSAIIGFDHQGCKHSCAPRRSSPKTISPWSYRPSIDIEISISFAKSFWTSGRIRT